MYSVRVSLGSSLKRLHPFKPDLASLTEPPFDPRRQHVLLGALSALEAFAGAILALPFLTSFAFAAFWVVEALRGRHPEQYHHFHHVHWGHLLALGVCTLLAAVLLWAGFALMLGRPYRYRAQGVLLCTVLFLLGAHQLAYLALVG